MSFGKPSVPASFEMLLKRTLRKVTKRLSRAHPSTSALFKFNRNPEWLVYHELVLTTREYCHNVTAVEPKWLVEAFSLWTRAVNVITGRQDNEYQRVENGTPDVSTEEAKNTASAKFARM